MGSSVMRRFATLALAGLAVAACSKARLVASTCQTDSDCDAGFLCDDFQCVNGQTKACDVVTDGNPILQPTPYDVVLGDLTTADAGMTVALHNIGNCTLTLFEASLADDGGSPFTCDLCDAGFPIEIFPGRSRDVQIGFHATEVGASEDALVLLSDDHQYPELRVPLHANFLGVPALNVAPNPVDFGYEAQGLLARKEVAITNQGSGVAAITVTSVNIEPVDDPNFELSAAVQTPVTLPPVSLDNSAIINLEVQYHPRSAEVHAATLVVQTDQGEFDIPLAGNAQTPPQITASPLSIDLGQVPLGQSNHAPLTLVNQGGAPLQISYSWGGPNPTTDLYAVPNVIPPIAPGAYLDLQVAFTATAIGPVDGLLVLTTNDPASPSLTIPVHAEGIAGPGEQVVKVEMDWDNGSNSAFDNDIRNVQMSLEHPFGYLCNKQTPSPTNWGNYGDPTWIAFGPKEEPQRIVLANATSDGTYRVLLSYQQDCSSLPTALTAGILGITGDALVAYLTSGIAQINGQDLSQAIANTCISHSGTNATVRVYVNGTVVKEATASLGSAGDSLYVVNLVRSGGTFTAN